MKKISFAIIPLLLGGCAFNQNEPISLDDDINVVLVDSDRFVSVDSNLKKVSRGSDVAFRVRILDGYALQGCDYRGDFSFSSEVGESLISLKDVCFDCRISLSIISIATGIRYNLNGGLFDDGSAEESYTVYFEASDRPRPNSEVGVDRIHRDGYCFAGWNSSPSGNGRHYGGGSMIDIEDQRIVDYYAEWIKETDPSLFVMTDNQLTDEDNLSITRFEGKNKDMDALVIPSSIGGKAITSIQSGAFSGLNIDRLFLPPCLGRIQKNAFSNCDIRSIYFFDSLGFIDNEAFGSPYGIAEVRINAFEKPRFRSISDNAIFSDDIERIISAKGKKKMVFFGGCSMSYGLDSEMIQERFPEYAVANCGVIGGCNADFQLSIISSFLEEGDIFVHAPEEMSEYQLLMNLDAENRMFVCVEGNYDLLSLCDCSRYRDFFLEYDTYVQTRKDLPASDYEEINLNYNGYGDYALPRVHQDYVRVSESMFRLDAFEDASVSRMNAYYDLFEDKDVTSVFSFAPLSADRQSEDELRERHAYEFEMLCHEKYDVRIISGIFDYLMPDEFFFDTEYHMTSEGARLRTSKLIDDLLASGEVENG